MKDYTIKEMRELFKEYLLTCDDSERFESYETDRVTAAYGENFLDWLEERELK